jgi:hypothetical protein
VLALMRVINGDAPLLAAQELIDPMVRIRMNASAYCGIDVWYKWMHLLRTWGRIGDLRIAEIDAQSDASDPSLVHVSGRWIGRGRKGMAAARQAAAAQYRVRDGRITEIWTQRSNYEFVFGPWIKYRAGYALILACAAPYFFVRSLSDDGFPSPAHRAAPAHRDYSWRVKATAASPPPDSNRSK